MMDAEEILHATINAGSTQEIGRLNDQVEQLFAEDKLTMTADNWIDYTNLLGVVHDSLSAKHM